MPVSRSILAGQDFAVSKKKGTYWSIGYQSYSDPFKWDPANATIYSPDQLPIDAVTLADPFLFKHEDTLYLFHEIVLKSVAGGKIGVSFFYTDSHKWIFQAIVLDEPFHLSYLYIFTHDSEIYMTPESKASESVRIYRATDFSLKWELEEIIIKDKKYVDPTICCGRIDSIYFSPENGGCIFIIRNH